MSNIKSDNEKTLCSYKAIIKKEKQLDKLIHVRAMTCFINAGGYPYKRPSINFKNQIL